MTPDTAAAPSTDVVVIPHPTTGEVIEVIAATPSDKLAGLRDAIVAHERGIIADYKAAIDAELRGRLDHENTRSATVGGWKITVPGPTTVVWDGARAYKAVMRLVRQGIISKAAALAAVERVVDYKPKHAALVALSKHADERVRNAIAECRADEPVANRRVSVTRVQT